MKERINPIKDYNRKYGVHFIKSIKKDIQRQNLSKLEKSYVIGGMTLGGIAAVVGVKLGLDNLINQDLISYTVSTIINASTFLLYYPASPVFWGMGIGKAIGDHIAYASKRKRESKR